MVVANNKSAYEKSRQKRMEENKKRMEDLKLSALVQALHTPKISPMKKVKFKPRSLPLDPSAVRRSSRVADLPPRSYREAAMEPMGRAKRYSGKRDLSNRVYASDEDRQYATDRAEELQAQLDQDIPSFVKPMLQSHVTGGFWLGLPLRFCKIHLPNRDVMFTLVDEDGEESQAKYLGLKNGLSGGWRGFALEHELVDGDALVFQLINPTSFKVYIIRVNDPGEK